MVDTLVNRASETVDIAKMVCGLVGPACLTGKRKTNLAFVLVVGFSILPALVINVTAGRILYFRADASVVVA